MIFTNEKKKKKSVDFWPQKLTLKVRFWHFLSNCHSSTVVFKTQVCWFRPKILLCRTHYLWIFTTELISENNYSIFNLIIQYSFDKYGFKNRLGPSAISQGPLKKWTESEHSQELHLLKIHSRVKMFLKPVWVGKIHGVEVYATHVVRIWWFSNKFSIFQLKRM